MVVGNLLVLTVSAEHHSLLLQGPDEDDRHIGLGEMPLFFCLVDQF